MSAQKHQIMVRAMPRSGKLRVHNISRGRVLISLPLALALSVDVTKLVEKAAMEWAHAARVAAGPPSGALSFLWAARYQGAMS
jgi:hypothetical protein